MPKKPAVKVGEVYNSRNSGAFEVLEYLGAKRVKVRFLSTGTEVFTRVKEILSASTKDPYSPSLYGVGYMGDYVKDELQRRCYTVWSHMLRRCYGDSDTYAYNRYGGRGVEVCRDWHCFANYQKWYNDNFREDFDVDKELISQYSKIYSPDTCSFVPNEVNKAVLETVPSKKGLPMGVTVAGSGRFFSRLNKMKERVYLGIYDTEDEAFLVYKKAKENYLRELADRHYALGNISLEVKESLYKWEIKKNREVA